MHPEPAKEIKIQGALTVENAAYALDGGSIMLSARDGGGVQHSILLVQHAFRDAPSGERLPGRLYFDGKLLPIRSQAEKTLIRALRAAEIGVGLEATTRSDGLARENALVLGEDVGAYLSAVSRGPIEATRHLIEDLASYVESEEYVKLAAEIESASIRSVLILKAPGNNRVAVMKVLRHALRLSLKEAKSLIERSEPELARGSKLEIDRLRNDLVAAGATVEQIDQG